MPRYRTVVFDCDSTLSGIEGIEELARAHRDEVARLTDAAMDGRIPLEQVYGARLALVQPARDAVAALGRRYIDALVPDAREVVAALREAGVVVRVISGGLRPAVVALAHDLGLDDADVAAVDVSFDAAGRYNGYDTTSPLARAGGKREVLAAWHESVPRPVMLVGDGATDLEGRPAVDAFVAFAGVVARQVVIDAADFVIDVRSLAPVLPLVLGDEVPAGLAARAVHERGSRMLAQSPRHSRTGERSPALNPTQL